jgi:hypothetical protein
MRFSPVVFAALPLLAACESTLPSALSPQPVPPPAPAPIAAPAPEPPPPPPPPALDRVPRLELNRIAVELALPLFWVADTNRSGAIDLDEIAGVWGIAPPEKWVEDGKLTPRFYEAYEAIVRVKEKGHDTTGLDEAEKKRRAAVVAELAQGRPSLVRSDFRAGSAEDKAIVEHVLAAAALVDRLYARQIGSFGLEAGIAPNDTASRAMFFRNHGPWCEAPKTDGDPSCGAIAPTPKKVSGLYPAKLQSDPKFCEVLEKRKDQKTLMSQFVVVREKGDELEAVPYHVAFKEDMQAVATELDAAAQAIASPGEAAFKTYLGAAAQAFRDGNWNPADEAWAKMSVANSKWYLRVAPDEVYFEPCSRKAGFHVSFARINQDSLAWQKKLDPVKNDMEGALAKLAGKPYKARSVTFHLPDFIDIVVNAGDGRNALGATIGQSLPNWGPVANEGRGRTVAMTNLYTDEDSKISFDEQTTSLFCPSVMKTLSFDPASAVMTTVLHEAAHNLGPAHEYKVNGKTDDESFGGPLASMLEELKAQTSAMYFTDWLVGHGLLDEPAAERAHARDMAWAFGHIAQGVYTASGKPKPYSQLASIQVGSFLAAGAMSWNASATAANGKDVGCFEIALDKMPAAVVDLEKQVLAIKARGDKKAATALRTRFVDDDGQWKDLRKVIQERWLRSPKSSFVYGIER